MMKLLEVGAFSLLIGGQFLAALVSIAMRSSLYPPLEADHLQALGPSEAIRRTSTQPAAETVASVSRERRAA
jgi:hypothetical protein